MKSRMMPKVIGFFIIVIAALLLVFGFFYYNGHMEEHDHDHDHEYSHGHIDIERVVTDEEHEYVCELGFSYKMEHEGDYHFAVWLDPDSSVTVEEYESTTPCKLTLYKDDQELWSDQIKAGMEITPGVEEGEYKFVLLLCGTGKGKIIVDDGCGEEHANP